MHNTYEGVSTRFLREDERLISSLEREMPFVIEANGDTSVKFLQQFLRTNSAKITNDISKYGAVLLRGFDVTSDEDFEHSVLSIEGFHGISEAFMSEEGRTHPGQLKYVLHTNAVYKTGGTLYLGGFHSENYYSTDVPTYLCFCCLQPSEVGGETGLINMEKLYPSLDAKLVEKLEKNTFFVAKWLVSEVAKRYNLSTEVVEKICHHFDLPIVGKGDNKFVLMYKPNIFEHPITKKKSLQINFFEIVKLNEELRKCFMHDYRGKTWFWHRFVWRLPTLVLSALEIIYMSFASFFHSPKESLSILWTKIKTFRAANKKNNLPHFYNRRVGSCFDQNDVKDLAQLMRNHYSSCLWKKGDIVLIDNRQVVHAGMPGAGPRKIRAMICNPIEMKYSFIPTGSIYCKTRKTDSVGAYMTTGTIPVNQTGTVSLEHSDV